MPGGDAIRLELPGSGGFGDPFTREPLQVLDDVLDGLISRDAARRDYGVAIDHNLDIDLVATELLRSRQSS